MRKKRSNGGDINSFIEEIRKYIRENEKWKKYWMEQWGNISRKLGTLVEDFVIPNIDAISVEITGEKPVSIFPRAKRRKNGKEAEFDVIAETSKYIILNETKSSLRKKDVSEILEKINLFREFFGEYRKKKVIPLLASLYVDPDVVREATRKKVYVVGLRGDLMKILNPQIDPESAGR